MGYDPLYCNDLNDKDEELTIETFIELDNDNPIIAAIN